MTLIASDIELEGDIHFSNELIVCGAIKGNIQASEPKSRLVLSEEGSISGEVRVPNVLIAGSVNGVIFAESELELASSAVVVGDLYYKVIEMQLGAQTRGRMIHQSDWSSRSEEIDHGRAKDNNSDELNDPEVNGRNGTADVKQGSSVNEAVAE